MSIESVMPSNHLILCRPLLLLPSIFPSIRVFSNESALCIRCLKYWSFSFNINPFSVWEDARVWAHWSHSFDMQISFLGPVSCVLTSWISSGHTVGSASLHWLAQIVKNLPAMWETQIRSLGQEDLLEKEMATHSSILAWRIPWTEEPGGLQSKGSQRVGHKWAINNTQEETEVWWLLNGRYSLPPKFP